MSSPVRLDTLIPGQKFRCPWNGKEFELEGITLSSAWVKVTEEVEFTVTDKRTGNSRIVHTKKKYNEPWSRTTMVEVLDG